MSVAHALPCAAASSRRNSVLLGSCRRGNDTLTTASLTALLKADLDLVVRAWAAPEVAALPRAAPAPATDHQPRALAPPQVNTKTLTLNYACSGLSLGTNVTRPKGRRMLHDDGHVHGGSDDYDHLHGHSATHDRRLKGIFDNPIVFPTINASLFNRKTASGVPILHSRSSSTKRIYLDFDGEGAVGALWARGCAAGRLQCCCCGSGGGGCAGVELGA